MMGCAFEVMRCFHIHYSIVARDNNSTTDLRQQAMEIANVCILLIMLSCVRNVVFVEKEKANLNTVFVTPSARHHYKHQPSDMNITFQGDTLLLSQDILDQVLNAIKHKSNITI